PVAGAAKPFVLSVDGSGLARALGANQLLVGNLLSQAGNPTGSGTSAAQRLIDHVFADPAASAWLDSRPRSDSFGLRLASRAGGGDDGWAFAAAADGGADLGSILAPGNGRRRG